ncbi:transposase [Salmonella enterica]|nr:transposase [Salmonella enterica]
MTDELYRYVMSGKKVHVDDSPVKARAPGTENTKKGHIWVYVCDDRNAGVSDPSAAWFAYSSD